MGEYSISFLNDSLPPAIFAEGSPKMGEWTMRGVPAASRHLAGYWDVSMIPFLSAEAAAGRVRVVQLGRGIATKCADELI